MWTSCRQWLCFLVEMLLLLWVLLHRLETFNVKTGCPQLISAIRIANLFDLGLLESLPAPPATPSIPPIIIQFIHSVPTSFPDDCLSRVALASLLKIRCTPGNVNYSCIFSVRKCRDIFALPNYKSLSFSSLCVSALPSDAATRVHAAK